jgi:hypothetical protein
MAQISRLHAQRILATNARLEYLCKIALEYDEIELAAAVVSEIPSIDDTLRKNLWPKSAKKIVSQNKSSIKPALAFLKRSELLRIEALLPFFQDFVVIEDFKVDDLKKAMDRSERKAQRYQK